MSTTPDLKKSEREKYGIRRILKRLKAVLRRGSSAQEAIASPGTSVPAENPSRTMTTSSIPPPASYGPATVAAEPIAISSQGGIRLLPDERPADQQDRVRTLFAKYHVEHDQSEWLIRPSRQSVRVEKPIRMRVRYICHDCRTNLSSSGECTNCHHQRCEKCTRVPPKKIGKEKAGVREEVPKGGSDKPIVLPAAGKRSVGKAAATAGVPSAEESEDEAEPLRPPLNIVARRPKWRNEVPLVVPSRTGGQDLVRKPPLQRIHRTCCRCNCSFERSSKQCSQCEHLRCTQCPRTPPKLDKWPNGYPGDVTPPEPSILPQQGTPQQG